MGLRWSWLRGGPTSSISGAARRATAHWTNPYLRGIKGPDGSRIAGVSNDDGGEGYNSRLNFTPTESGTHYIIAGAYSGLGAYEVEVRDVSPQTAQQKETTENGSSVRSRQTSYAFSLAENADGGASSVVVWARYRRRTRKTRRLPIASRRATPVACSPSTQGRAPCRTRARARTTSRARPATS